jgi:hypothetical protein
MTSIRCSIRVSLLVLLLAGSARAQTETARAESLFREGKKLLAQQQYDQACPKFAESARIEPSSGVELALAICYEGAGKLASAWGAYTTAIALARRDGRPDRVEAATQAAAVLEPKLARVSIAVAPRTAALAGLEIRQDGVVLGTGAWSGSPVDSGSHTLEAKAPGHVPFTTVFTIENAAPPQTVTVPTLQELAPSPPEPPSQPSPVERQRPSGLLRTAEYIGIGTGLALVIPGLITGAIAISDARDVRRACPTTPCSNASAVSENQTAGTLADTSTGLLVAGGALIAGGVLMVLFAPTPTAASTTSTARAHVDWGPGFLRGTF